MDVYTFRGCRRRLTAAGLVMVGLFLAAESMRAQAHEGDQHQATPVEEEIHLGHDGEELTPERRSRVLHLATEHEVTLGAGLTLVAQGMDDGVEATDDSGMTYSADIALEGDFGSHGIAFIYINSAQGTGVAPAVATGVNADNETGDLVIDGEGFSDTRIAEAWYQFYLGESTRLTVGKIDPTGIFDGNAIANDETAQFLADPFVNNPAIAFPGYAGGINLGYEANDHIAVNLGVFENTGDFSGALDSAFSIAEVGLAGDMLGGREGHLRLIAWSEDSNDNEGFAVSADQAFSDTVAVMFRYGTQEDTEPFDSAASIGGQWARGVHTVGAAYSLLTATAVGADDESAFEAYYSYALSDHIYLTADVQRISSPDFDPAADDITVYGVRGQFDL